METDICLLYNRIVLCDIYSMYIVSHARLYLRCGYDEESCIFPWGYTAAYQSVQLECQWTSSLINDLTMQTTLPQNRVAVMMCLN